MRGRPVSWNAYSRYSAHAGVLMCIVKHSDIGYLFKYLVNTYVRALPIIEG